MNGHANCYACDDPGDALRRVFSNPVGMSSILIMNEDSFRNRFAFDRDSVSFDQFEVGVMILNPDSHGFCDGAQKLLVNPVIFGDLVGT